MTSAIKPQAEEGGILASAVWFTQSPGSCPGHSSWLGTEYPQQGWGLHLAPTSWMTSTPLCLFHFYSLMVKKLQSFCDSQRDLLCLENESISSWPLSYTIQTAQTHSQITSPLQSDAYLSASLLGHVAVQEGAILPLLRGSVCSTRMSEMKMKQHALYPCGFKISETCW